MINFKELACKENFPHFSSHSTTVFSALILLAYN